MPLTSLPARLAQEWELFKVWDSLEYESEEEERAEHGFKLNATVEGEGTKQLMCFGAII